MKLGSYSGNYVPDADERIDEIVALWQEAVPGDWKRSDHRKRLLDPNKRYCRRNFGKDDVRWRKEFRCDIGAMWQPYGLYIIRAGRRTPSRGPRSSTSPLGPRGGSRSSCCHG